ncbi:MAG: flavin reductase [Prevotella sp.]|jgi:flavin reductase (DIM6/NTAB) family NADH-FMN oxidoreductase RutF|nr:flavin reductase [Prevotella sp.]
MNKHRILLLAALAVLTAACGNKSDNQSENNKKQEKTNDVAGRKNFGPNHALVTTPQPCVMIATWDENKTPDVMMAAWAGQLDYKHIVISLSEHKTTDNLALTKAFTVSFADERTVAESDYFGLVSGRKVANKVERVGFSVTPSPNVDAPIINEYPLTLECRVVSFEDGMLIGQVINQSAADSILTDGKVDLTKLKPIVFDNAALTYRTIGGEVGKAWGAGKKFINE